MLRDLTQRKNDVIRTGQMEGDNLLGLLLQSHSQNNLPENVTSTKDDGMTLEEVIQECKQFYLAGPGMIVLAMHSNWEDKPREEVLQICGRMESDSEALTHLKIVSISLY